MSRGYAFFGLVGAAACGVFTVYTTFQPEFERRRLEKEGKLLDTDTLERQKKNETILSDAIRSDLKEAGEQVKLSEKGGFAWGIRQFVRDQFTTNDSSKPPEKS